MFLLLLRDLTTGLINEMLSLSLSLSLSAVDGLSVGNINSTRTGVDWVSFEVVLRRSKHFADGLLQLGIQPKATFGIYSINSAEYTMAEYSCYRHSIVVIPIYETLGSNVCVFIAKQGTQTVSRSTVSSPFNTFFHIQLS